MNTDAIINDGAHAGAGAGSRPAAHRPLPIKLLASTVLRGCNIHHGSTVIREKIDLGALAGMCSDKAGPEFARRFLERFFEMRRLIPDSTMPESFVERLCSPGGAPFAEVLLEAILAVETAMAFRRHDLEPIGFSTVVPTGSPRKVLLVWECKLPTISHRAAEVALAGCVELMPEGLHPHRRAGSRDFATAFAALEARTRCGEVSTTTAVLALAAKRRGLPCEAVSGPYLRLGHGASQHLIYASTTQHTSLLASQLALNKHRANRRLAELHLPIARQIRVGTAAQALAAAGTLGYPVVLKPLNQNQAIGVSIGITSPDDVPDAFAHAAKESKRAGRCVIVETFVRGHAHRLLVVGGRFVAALKTVPATVTGDGLRTIAELVAELNTDPLRNGVRLFKVPIDDALVRDLALVGYRLDDVLDKDRTIALRSAANVAIGGLHSDITESVHPDNQEIAIRATEGIGLDIAGVDFVTEDISRSYKEVGGAILEVNARPGLCMHTFPRYGKGRPVGAAVLELLFPPGASGLIPIAVVAGRRGTRRVARELEAILRASGRSVAFATRKRCFIDGEAADVDKVQRRDAVPILLRDKRVQTLISCVSPRRTAKRGLSFETCDVAAVVGRGADGSAERGFRQGIEVVARAARGVVVVSAKNNLAQEALSALEAKRVILVATDSKDPAVAPHAAAGGAVVMNLRGQEQEQDRIVLQREQDVLVSIPVAGAGDGISERQNERRRIQSRMFAIALAFGMGLSGREIEAAVRAETLHAPKRTLRGTDLDASRSPLPSGKASRSGGEGLRG